MWSFLLTDANYKPVGEILNAKDRRVAKVLSKLDSASFNVRLDHPMADNLLTCQGYVKAYRNNQPQFFGPVISAEESGSNMGATVAVNCVSVGWFLQKRLAGKSATGRVFSSATDRAVVAKTLIDEMNAETNGETGIQTATTVGSGSAVTYTAGPYKPVLESVNELANAYDGFEWRIVPIDNFTDGVVTGLKIGEFQASQVIGSQKSNTVFEWGIGRNNIVSYTRSRNREQQANKVYHAVNQGADAPGYPVISAIDADSITNYRLMEDLAAADLLDTTLRTQFVQQHVYYRRYPREIITFEPHIDPRDTGRLPQFGTDYDIGDSVRARAAYNNKLRWDSFFRVYGVDFSISDLGVEKANLTLTLDA
jgi:hypothetical protein